jgi:hypothetical protein
MKLLLGATLERDALHHSMRANELAHTHTHTHTQFLKRQRTGKIAISSVIKSL